MLFSSAALRNASRMGIRRFPTANTTSSANSAAMIQLRQKSSSSGGIPSTVLSQWYGIFGKSTIGYATWLVAGILVAETMTGTMSDAVWNSVNSGRTYESVDWTKFKSDDDDDDEDDEDDEDEEEEEEEGDEEDDDDDDE
mmetsp:Transcript_26300/g.63136  ORF Transcript_26300/g.63136 Transcript_26300/m.63136 type:complete len:140 (+) Transcript_26300:175-594(+)|eukprot:CAMPEP_0181125926 /NCGR_PEP_ID=MMETSP1071-20121207/27329_1 /TAXON_ID=35127 /ORGANISM="Thalassiosira sp., Strain NH16" /LENGTH=139 /DNA_ID=CAMNT_0023211439 /DNA_START=197 /DNA_END=616 /DNA_ORIENTATION=+